MMKQILLGMATIALLSSCIGTKPRSSRKRSAGSTAGSGLSFVKGAWSKSALPITVSLSQDFTASEIEQMKSVGLTWQKDLAPALHLINFGSQLVPHLDNTTLNSYLDGNIQVHRVYRPLFNEGVLALTLYRGYRNANGILTLTDAEIVFNYYDYDFSTESVSGKWDLASVFVHEVGHLLGLDHIEQYNSVMSPVLGATEQKRTLFSYDYQIIDQLYSSYTLAGSTAIAHSSLGENRGKEVIGMIEMREHHKCQRKELVKNKKAFTHWKQVVSFLTQKNN